MALPLKIATERICKVAEGQTDTDIKPGDFILTYHDGIYSHLIRIGQLFRFRGKDACFAKYTHAALVVNTEGDIIEALAGGIVQSHISKYSPQEYIHIGILASDEDRTEILSFAKSCVGEKYGWATILSIAFSLLTGAKFSFGFDGQEICSGLVARALERSTAIFPRDGSHIMPADLAKYYLPLLTSAASEAKNTPPIANAVYQTA